MRTVLATLLLAGASGLAAAGACSSPREIKYEPEVVELKGQIVVARAPHPNGTMMKYPIMRLTRPVSVQADGANPINAAESCVSEIQLTSNDDATRNYLYAAAGKRVVAFGTVLHSQTAWHMRPLIAIVKEARNEP